MVRTPVRAKAKPATARPARVRAARPARVRKPASTKSSKSGLRGIDSAQVIRVVPAENPKRAGSKAFTKFAEFRDGMTVAQYLALPGTRPWANHELRWNLRAKLLKLDPAPSS